MALKPDAIDLDGLPRTIGGGLKREPVEELLKRIQWEYSQLYYEHKRLKEDSEQRGAAGSGLGEKQQRTAPTSAAEPPVAREDEPTSTVKRPENAPATRAAPTTAQPAALQSVEHAQHRDLDDLARLVLASAHRASTELRESARRDCELMLKKTRERVADRERSLEQTETKRSAELMELERDFERIKAARAAELQELEELLGEIRGQMKATLDVLIPGQPDPDPDPQGVVERRDHVESEDVAVRRSDEVSAENRDPGGEPSQVAAHTGFEAAS